MRGAHLVVAIGADQHQVFHVGMRQQILDQIERGRVEPLQVVKEQGERMLPRERADEAPKYQLEAALRILRRKFGNRRLLPDDELQLGDEVHHELTIRTERFADGIAPTVQFGFALRQNRTDQALERLRESGIRNVALVLVEFARGKKPSRAGRASYAAH